LFAVTCRLSLRQHWPNDSVPSDSVTTPTSEDTAAAKSPVPSGSDQPEKKGGFFPATYEELKLVVWPSRQQLFSESIAVILMVSLSAAAIAALSRFYGWAASQVFR
jgi:preprotein translocase subunit SecE